MCVREISFRLALVSLTLTSLMLSAGCSSKSKDPTRPPDIEGAEEAPTLEVTLPRVRFSDITQSAKVSFKHVNGSTGKKLLPETMGSGVAFLDYDNDGQQDLLYVNSCHWPGSPESTREQATLKLFRNRGQGAFEDVTSKAGLAISLYGMGVTCGDYDNDGKIDIFVTAVGSNRLFHNLGDRFEEVTARASVGGPGGWPVAGVFEKCKEPINFSSSAAFLDYDGDARLDLFVCNYVTWAPLLDLDQGFTLTGIGRAFGPPRAFEGTTCFLYRNLGNGRFEDVSERAGVRVLEEEGVGERGRKRPAAKSLGVVVCDVDEDGWPDIVVANDTVRNFFFHNNKGERFEEKGLASGIAYATSQPNARGAMGVDWGEYRPGKHALLIANFADEPNTFLRQQKPASLLFQDVALVEGIAGRSRPPLKFGAFFFDLDLDGRQDFLTCNGHLEPDITQVHKNQSFPQKVQLYWNTGLPGKRAFEQLGEKDVGSDLFVPMVGRGCAYADIDGDGDLDVVLTANGGEARLLRNEGGTGHHWLRLVLEGDGVRSNRSAIGARVEIKVGERVLRREILGTRGYLSQSELPITVGLGDAKKVDEVVIYWPGARAGKQVLKDLPADKSHVIRQQ